MFITQTVTCVSRVSRNMVKDHRILTAISCLDHQKKSKPRVTAIYHTLLLSKIF